MPKENRKVRPGRIAGTVLTETGEQLVPPSDWDLLPPGDGPLTKLVKAKGPTWCVHEKVGRRIMSRGVWASKSDILAALAEVEAKRTAPGYQQQQQRRQLTKETKHQDYVVQFHAAVLGFLGFHQRYVELAETLADRVTSLATPVGSGTVARTERIPLADRARAAVIAWLRHQATDYEKMTIARVRGRRREVRRQLAGKSLELLVPYRQGKDILQGCRLFRVIGSNDDSLASPV